MGSLFVDAAKRLGYDGATIKEEDLEGNSHDLGVAFSPNQIKSAIGNSGAFDPENRISLLSRSVNPEERDDSETLKNFISKIKEQPGPERNLLDRLRVNRSEPRTA